MLARNQGEGEGSRHSTTYLPSPSAVENERLQILTPADHGTLRSFYRPRGDDANAGLLMRPEHNETEAKTETRECETETETKKLLRPRPKTTRPIQRPVGHYDQFNCR